MRSIDSVSRSVNYKMTAIDHTIKKIVTNPSAAKKVVQIADKIFEAYDLCFKREGQKREINVVLKGAKNLIDFYGTYKNIMFWVNLFSKETLDQKALEESILETLLASSKPRYKNRRTPKNKIAQRVFNEVMAKKEYHSKSEVFEALKASLNKQGYSDLKAQQIAEKVVIKQKARSPVQLISMACFTLVDLGSNFAALKKWNLLDLSRLAATIGNQSRVFMFVIELGADMVLGVVASAGLVLVVGEAAYRAITYGRKYYSSPDDSKDKEEAYKELRLALIDIFAGTTELVAAAAPLLFALNPPAIVALALVAKGTGLICILIR